MSGPRRKKVPKGFKPQKQVEVIDHDQEWLRQQQQQEQEQEQRLRRQQERLRRGGRMRTEGGRRPPLEGDRSPLEAAAAELPEAAAHDQHRPLPPSLCLSASLPQRLAWHLLGATGRTRAKAALFAWPFAQKSR
eukprot:COSAG03_NODE_6762_length_1009_cov_1.301099_1_plen_134_part_00